MSINDPAQNHTFALCAYKESPYLEDCVQSLLAQTVKSKIFLATSTDNAHIRAVAEKYSLPLFVNPQNPGIATDWQFALECAHTQYVTIAHQDDVYYPEYTASILPMMERSVIGFSNYEELTEHGVRAKTGMLRVKRMLLWPFYFKHTIKNKFVKKSILRFGSPLCCPSVMYNRKLAQGELFDASYHNNLDWDAWLRFAEQEGAFAYSKRILMAHRIHAESETSKQIASAGRAQEDKAMFQRLWPGFLADLIMKFYARSYTYNQNDAREEKAE